MKKFILGAFCFMALTMQAVDYCASSSWGYAGTGVTGGGNATPKTVSTYSELKNALKDNSVVIIIADITVEKQVAIDGKNSITLMALPGKKLISTSQEKETSGILSVKNSSSNIILRNLTFEGPGAYDCDGKDNLTVTGSHNIWVDHCDFQDGCDGNFDINKGSDNITVSWCRFRYKKGATSGGSGGADDHRFTNLIGSDDGDKPEDGTFNVTFAYCWWDHGCKERMTRCRNAEIHNLNCYWNSNVSNYYVRSDGSSNYFEGCLFEGRANEYYRNWEKYDAAKTDNCTFVNCEGNGLSNIGSVAAPKYSYAHLTPSQTKEYVTHSTCGAGATLKVTTSGEVSSSCDGSTPTIYTVTWDASSNGGTCATATSEVEEGKEVGTLPSASRDGYSFDGWFTQKSGGTRIGASTTITSDITYYAQFTQIVVPTPSGDALFYWRMVGRDAPANDTQFTAFGGTLTVRSTDATKTFTVESSAYVDGVPDDMKAKDEKALKNVGAALYIEVELSSGGFKKGDTIYICGYNKWMISSNASRSGDVASSISTGTDKNNYALNYFVLTSDVDVLYFSRVNAAATGVSAITVIRPKTNQGTSTDLEAVEAQEAVRKILIDKKIYIMRGTHIYDMSGQRIQ